MLGLEDTGVPNSLAISSHPLIRSLKGSWQVFDYFYTALAIVCTKPFQV